MRFGGVGLPADPTPPRELGCRERDVSWPGAAAGGARVPEEERGPDPALPGERAWGRKEPASTLAPCQQKQRFWGGNPGSQPAWAQPQGHGSLERGGRAAGVARGGGMAGWSSCISSGVPDLSLLSIPARLKLPAGLAAPGGRRMQGETWAAPGAWLWGAAPRCAQPSWCRRDVSRAWSISPYKSPKIEQFQLCACS